LKKLCSLMVEHTLTNMSSFSFIWFTDFHWDYAWGTKAAYKDCFFSNESLLGISGCDPPEALVDSAINEAYRLLPLSPFILITGDFDRHENYNHTEKLVVESKLMGKIRNKFPEALLLPSIGNNDLLTHWEMNVTTELPYDQSPVLTNSSWLTRVAEA